MTREPDYDEDKDQLEEEQEEEAGGITTTMSFELIYYLDLLCNIFSIFSDYIVRLKR